MNNTNIQLVNEKDGSVINVGDKVTTFRGQEGTLAGFDERRVYVKFAGEEFNADYLPSVIGAVVLRPYAVADKPQLTQDSINDLRTALECVTRLVGSQVVESQLAKYDVGILQTTYLNLLAVFQHVIGERKENILLTNTAKGI
jgi:hypothetical protein